MNQVPVYTIGHGARKIAELIQPLKDHGIKYLLDVRSQPYSRHHPQFSRDALQRSLQENGIRYVFMGDLLGGRPSDPGCYDEEGKVDYERVKTMDFFKAGIGRIKTAYASNLPIALMCSERDPSHCHRSKLIGPVLVEEKIHLLHIDEKDQLRNQTEIMARNPENGGRESL